MPSATCWPCAVQCRARRVASVLITEARKQGYVTMQVSMMNMAGEKVGEVELADAIFAAPINKPLMHQALMRQLANARLGTHKVKGRSEVAGGGRKPWKQKGTGRARQGSTRAAQWRGGGIIFGPTPRSYEQQMPRKMRRAAVCSALSVKAAEERRSWCWMTWRMAEPKTREMAQVLHSLAVDCQRADPDGGRRSRPWSASANNLPDVKLLRAELPERPRPAELRLRGDPAGRAGGDRARSWARAEGSRCTFTIF